MFCCSGKKTGTKNRDNGAKNVPTYRFIRNGRVCYVPLFTNRIRKLHFSQTGTNPCIARLLMESSRLIKPRRYFCFFTLCLCSDDGFKLRGCSFYCFWLLNKMLYMMYQIFRLCDICENIHLWQRVIKLRLLIKMSFISNFCLFCMIKLKKAYWLCLGQEVIEWWLSFTMFIGERSIARQSFTSIVDDFLVNRKSDNYRQVLN